jgi:hypothetical protein
MNKLQGGAMLGVLACGLLGGLAVGCSENSEPAPAGLLPVDKAVESWVRAASPLTLNTDAQLYNQIDGGAPKYIDRGWVSSAYATYSQGGSTLQVAIHNMGSSENAQAIYEYDLPVSRIGINEPLTAVVDMGLSTAYASIAHTGQYYIEVNIDDRSDAALVSIKAVMLSILNSNSKV